MRIAFYAPLKPPNHPTPSGDRRVARLLAEALRHAGHTVEVASRFRSRATTPDPAALERLRSTAVRIAYRMVERTGTLRPEHRPDLWFTYHLYYKAPDWLGPTVSKALGIPYVVAEASHAPKRAGGPWAKNHAAVEAAIRQADLVVGLNSDDAECVTPLLKPTARTLALKPFLDPAPFFDAAADRTRRRAALAKRLALDPAQPWLLAVAMMRPGDKAASYRVLAEALARITDRPWQLVVVGDGEAQLEVERCFAPIDERVRFVPAVAPDALPEYYAAADLFVWPAVNEAIGMAILEAQASGVAVVAGGGRGVPGIVEHGGTGLLTPVGDAAAFAEAVATLLDGPALRTAMGAAATARVAQVHAIDGAAERLGAALAALISSRQSPL